MHHCLSKYELKEIINCKLRHESISDTSIIAMLEKAESWDLSLGCMTYLFSMIMEKYINDGVDISDMVDDFYFMENSIYIIIQEFDLNFIHHLIRNVRENSLTLEEELIRLQTNIGNYNYDKTLRF